jgi:hypothetical protein
MKKSVRVPMAAENRRELLRVLACKYNTIRDFAIELIKFVRSTDEDNRDIGLDYGYVRDAIIRKFPTVRSSGPHRGRPTKMPIKELHEIACELNRNGVKLPFRPRRKTISKKK